MELVDGHECIPDENLGRGTDRYIIAGLGSSDSCLTPLYISLYRYTYLAYIWYM